MLVTQVRGLSGAVYVLLTRTEDATSCKTIHQIPISFPSHNGLLHGLLHPRPADIEDAEHKACCRSVDPNHQPPFAQRTTRNALQARIYSLISKLSRSNHEDHTATYACNLAIKTMTQSGMWVQPYICCHQTARRHTSFNTLHPRFQYSNEFIDAPFSIFEDTVVYFSLVDCAVSIPRFYNSN